MTNISSWSQRSNGKLLIEQLLKSAIRVKIIARPTSKIPDHWKSNEHLGASMTGDTDLDILFDNNNKEKLIEILRNESD